MALVKFVPWIAAGLVLAKALAEFLLARLDRRSILAHADRVPEAHRDTMDPATYARSVSYSLARNAFGQAEDAYGAALLLLVLFSGCLPWGLQVFGARFGGSAWSLAAFLFCTGLALSLPELPLEWLKQFRLEARYGFNASTQGTWWLDRAKGLLLALVLGYPLLVLLLALVRWTGDAWWLWGWGALCAFQLLMLVLAPVLIMPLFNRFTPLPEGTLKERLLALAGRTRFVASRIQVMDGSRRSRHSNAFFTGFGRFRKIVLFDTLVQQLTEPELEAVLAHEIGHFKLRHILQRLAVAILGSLAGFWLLAVLARQPWFAAGFGFAPGSLVPALLLFSLLGGAVTFWLSPIANAWSRHHEYQADAFAAATLQDPAPLVAALRKLNAENLSNLTPHPVWSWFHHSHPTLLEREAALAGKGGFRP